MGVEKENRKRVSGFSIFFVLALWVMATPAHAVIGTDIRIGNTVVTAANAGTISADIQFGSDLAPYIGVGWGNAADEGFLPFGIGLSVDLGVLYHGKSEVSLSQVGNTPAGLIPQVDLALEALNLENSLNEVKWFPVATIGLHIAF